MKDKVEDLFIRLRTSIFDGERERLSCAVIGGVCFLMSIIMIIFVLINLLSDMYQTAVISGISVVVYLVTFFLCAKCKRKQAVVMLTSSVCVACTLFTIMGTADGFAILWTTILPIAAMYMVNVLVGIAIGVYFSILFMVCFWLPYWEEHFTGLYSEVFIQRYPVLFVGIVLVSGCIMIQYHLTTLEQIQYENRLREAVAMQTESLQLQVHKMEKLAGQMITAMNNTVDAKSRGYAEQGHMVGKYALALARKMEWDETVCQSLQYGAMIYDAGRVGISDEVWNKPEDYSEEEKEVMQLHTVIGCNMFREVSEFPEAVGMIRNHHERWDGKGYPDGLKRLEIPQCARVISIADAYHAMRSERPFRKAMSKEEAIQELKRCAGYQFDPEYTSVFVKMLENEEI